MNVVDAPPAPATENQGRMHLDAKQQWSGGADVQMG